MGPEPGEAWQQRGERKVENGRRRRDHAALSPINLSTVVV